MDELEVLKLKYDSLEKNYNNLLLRDREMDAVLGCIASSVGASYGGVFSEYKIHSYTEDNPIFKALNIQPDSKCVKEFLEVKKAFNDDRSTKTQC